MIYSDCQLCEYYDAKINEADQTANSQASDEYQRQRESHVASEHGFDDQL